MITLRFEEQDKTFTVNYTLLKSLAYSLDSDMPQFKELVECLLAENIPSIDVRIAEHIDTDDEGFRGIVDTLWARGNRHVRRKLSHKGFFHHLTDEQARDIISDNDVNVLEDVANWAEVFCEESLPRLSLEVAEELVRHVSSHPDSIVRKRFVQNPDMPDGYLELADCIKAGSLPKKHLKKLSLDDVKLLENAPEDLLEDIADDLERIALRKVRIAVGKLLAGHRDPDIRLALAKNNMAPLEVLQILIDDTEPDVVATAKASMAKKEQSQG